MCKIYNWNLVTTHRFLLLQLIFFFHRLSSNVANCLLIKNSWKIHRCSDRCRESFLFQCIIASYHAVKLSRILRVEKTQCETQRETSFTAVRRTVIQTITISRVLQIQCTVAVSACIALERSIKEVHIFLPLSIKIYQNLSKYLHQVSLKITNSTLWIFFKRSNE